MRPIDKYNPIVTFVYFMLTAGGAMFFMHPLLIFVSLVGSLTLFFLRNQTNSLLSHVYFFALFTVMALINPLFQHNGKTVLFVLNDNPVTLEALLYGVVSSATIISVIYWFRSFSQIMTGDKLLYIFGSVSPKFALLISMALRYIPLFGEQTKRVNSAQKAIGLYKEDNPIDAIRGGTRIFSVMVTWALENGIITADSMTARGYGIGRRTFFAKYHFSKSDTSALILIVLLSFFTYASLICGHIVFEFYPSLDRIDTSPWACTAYISYAALCLLPSINEIGDIIRWRCLKSKI